MSWQEGVYSTIIQAVLTSSPFLVNYFHNTVKRTGDRFEMPEMPSIDQVLSVLGLTMAEIVWEDMIYLCSVIPRACNSIDFTSIQSTQHFIQRLCLAITFIIQQDRLNHIRVPQKILNAIERRETRLRIEQLH